VSKIEAQLRCSAPTPAPHKVAIEIRSLMADVAAPVVGVTDELDLVHECRLP
jgi:hypothetical protein